MTSYIDFAPSSIFESFLKTKLLIDEGHPEMSEPIEVLYRRIYDDSDSIEFITYKFQQINKLINSILVENQNDPETMQHFKNDVAVVFVFKTIAIKIYKLSTIVLKGHDKLYHNLLIKNECPYLEHIYRTFVLDSLDIYVVISKVEDVTTFKQSLGTASSIIQSHIKTALTYLKTNGWNHCDVSIDNIGFNSETNNFILFDFGLSKFSSLDDELDKGLYTDLLRFNRSIKFHLEPKD
jgi:serine/threonine protein kinase